MVRERDGLFRDFSDIIYGKTCIKIYQETTYSGNVLSIMSMPEFALLFNLMSGRGRCFHYLTILKTNAQIRTKTLKTMNAIAC